MDFDFPLFLVIATGVTGAIALLDRLTLGRARKAEILKLTSQGAPEEAIEAAKKEPALVEYSVSFFPILALVLVLRSFLVEPFQIPSGSMEPTLVPNDFILVNKFHYGLRLPVARTKVLAINEPQRGDVMVFFPPHDKRYFIKRVVGLPGDKIVYRDKQLSINGEAVEKQFLSGEPPFRPVDKTFVENLGSVPHEIKEKSYPNRRAEGEWVVPEGHFFMMGDNRDNSADSRFWGFVPEENIVGKAFAKWMYWDSIMSLPSFSRVGAIE